MGMVVDVDIGSGRRSDELGAGSRAVIRVQESGTSPETGGSLLDDSAVEFS